MQVSAACMQQLWLCCACHHAECFASIEQTLLCSSGCCKTAILHTQSALHLLDRAVICVVCLQIFMLFLAHAYACQQRFRKPQNRGPLPSSEVSHYGDVVVDGGFYLLWPCLVPWLLFEGDMAYAWLHHLTGVSPQLTHL